MTAMSQIALQFIKVISEFPLGCKNLLNFTCHTNKFHNCNYTRMGVGFSKLVLIIYQTWVICKPMCAERLLPFPPPLPARSPAAATCPGALEADAEILLEPPVEEK